MLILFTLQTLSVPCYSGLMLFVQNKAQHVSATLSTALRMLLPFVSASDTWFLIVLL